MLRLEAKDIYAGYGKIEVLHGASLRAAAGEIICIIGPNGSGKSTLLKTVFGLIKPTKGTVSFDGRDVTRLDPEQKVPLGIAFIPQGRNVFPSLTVRENLEMGGTALNSEKAVRLAIEEAVEAYPLLKGKIRERAGNLSGGEKQILSLARADMVKPGLILMDEPSIGLSPRMIDEVYEKIGEINRRGTWAGPAWRTPARASWTTRKSGGSTSAAEHRGTGFRGQGTGKDNSYDTA